jgi:hypothetical protein
MRDQATAVRPPVGASSLLIVALAHREHRVPARAIARRTGAQPMCDPIAVPARRARPVRVLDIAGSGDIFGRVGPVHWCPCQRFANDSAELEIVADDQSFRVEIFHPLSTAGLPAHRDRSYPGAPPPPVLMRATLSA